MASCLELGGNGNESLLESFPCITEDDNDACEPIDFSARKPRRSYVMEDLGDVRNNMNIKKWIMDQVEMKLCVNKEELLKDLREKDFAIQKLQDELEGLRLNREPLPHQKASNLPKATKSTVVGKPSESDLKISEKTNSATLKRAIKIEDKSASVATNKMRTFNLAAGRLTTTKTNTESVKITNRDACGGRGIFRSKTFRGEYSTSKDVVSRNVGSRNLKMPEDKKHFVAAKKALFGSTQGSHLDQNVNATAANLTESALANNSEMSANLKRLTEEHSKLQAEYARVRKLLIEANTKCGSGMTSPIPPECVKSTDTASLSDQTDDMTKSLMVAVDVNKMQNNENLELEFNDGSREGFRREVLRLKEELLASQHQCRILSDNKNQLEQDLTERENILVQFSRQMEQMNIQHEELISEKAAVIYKLTETVDKLKDRITEMESEFSETKEFLQEENNTLSEALKDSEEKTWQYCADVEKLHYQLETKEKRCEVLSKMVDQAQSQLHALQSELSETQDNAQRLIVSQGAELNDVSCAVKQLHDLVLNIKDAILEEASAFGVDINNSPDRSNKIRRSCEGRRLVQAILEAAKGGVDGNTLKSDAERSFTEEDYCSSNSASIPKESSNINETLSSNHVKDIHTSVETLGKMMGKFMKFTITLLDEAKEEKNKLEVDLGLARLRMEEFQKEVEENYRKRWSVEEKNKELTKELFECRTSLRDARESLREMWTAINEKASWLIENKKLREELATLKNQYCQLEADRNLLLDELKERQNNEADTTSQVNGNKEFTDAKQDPLFLKQQISNMQRLIINKEEEFQDTKKKHERQMQTTNKNLQLAEKEVRKLDKIIDHVLQVLLNAHDLDLHPVLQQLWKDLDGPGYVATKFDETATIV